MKDDGIRESLRQAAAGEPPAGDAYARFEVARRRANVARAAVLIVVGIVVATSFAFVFPNPFTSGQPANFQPGGEFDPLDRFVNVYRDDVVGFEARYPTTWAARGSDGAPAVFVEKVGGRVPQVVARDGGFETPVRAFIRVSPHSMPCIGAGASRSCRKPDRDGFATYGATVEELAAGTVAGRTVEAFRASIPGSLARRDLIDLARRYEIPCMDCVFVSFWIRWSDRWQLRIDALAPDADALGALLSDADTLVSSLRDHVARPLDD